MERETQHLLTSAEREHRNTQPRRAKSAERHVPWLELHLYFGHGDGRKSMYRWWWEWKRSWSASPFLVGDDAALYIRVLAIGDDATSAVDKRFEGKLDDKDHRGRYRFAHVSCQQYGRIKGTVWVPSPWDVRNNWSQKSRILSHLTPIDSHFIVCRKHLAER